MTHLEPGSSFGAYRVEHVLGQGGMGVVYLATQLALERPVALKLLTPEFAQDEQFRTRFKRESRLLASIDHPNVINIYEAGELDGTLFLSMRYVRGTDMRKLIRAEGHLEPARVAALLDQVAAALDAAHAEGLVHRDVKPGNVLIERRDGHEHAYLSDFGLTKRTGDSTGQFTRTGQWVGSVDYAAPEQVLGEGVDARTDVYALGCVAYVAITGRSPFPRENEYATMFAHVNDPPPSLRDADPSFPTALDSVVRRALAKRRDDRFPSAGDLARAIRAGIEGHPAPASGRSVASGAAAAAESEQAKLEARTTAAEESEPVQPAAAPAPTRRTGRPGRRAITAAIAVLLLAAGAGALILAGGGGSGDDDGEPASLGAPEELPAPGGRPAAIATDAEDVYVATSAGVARYDAAEPGEPLRARLAGTPDGIAVGEEGVWILSNQGVYPLDENLRKDQFPDRLAEVGRQAGYIAVGEGSLWAASDDASGRVYRLDPATGLRTGTVELDEYPGGLAVGGGAVWVTGGENGVARIDPETLEITAEATVKSYPGPIGIGEERVWIGATGQDLAVPLDADSAEPAGNPAPTGLTPVSIGVGDGALWTANHYRGEGTIVQIDEETGEPLGEPVRVGAEPIGVVYAGDALWVIERAGEKVLRLPTQ